MLKDTDIETDTLTLLAVLTFLFFHQSDESGDSSEDEKEDDKGEDSGENGKKWLCDIKTD